MDHLLIICFALSFISLGHGHRMCTIDTDCEDLGSLSCVKSGCNWGVCGCSRGYAARFVGSSKGYRCVKLKKIGESCTTDDTTGVCGASNSDCVNGECTCDSGFEARWGGEECLSKQTPYPTETCSASLGAACGGSSSCASNGAWNGAYSGTPVSDLPNSPFDDVPNVCACATGFRTVIPNDYDLGAFVPLGSGLSYLMTMTWAHLLAPRSPLVRKSQWEMRATMTRTVARSPCPTALVVGPPPMLPSVLTTCVNVTQAAMCPTSPASTALLRSVTEMAACTATQQ